MHVFERARGRKVVENDLQIKICVHNLCDKKTQRLATSTTTAATNATATATTTATATIAATVPISEALPFEMQTIISASFVALIMTPLNVPQQQKQQKEESRALQIDLYMCVCIYVYIYIELSTYMCVCDWLLVTRLNQQQKSRLMSYVRRLLMSIRQTIRLHDGRASLCGRRGAKEKNEFLKASCSSWQCIKYPSEHFVVKRLQLFAHYYCYY